MELDPIGRVSDPADLHLDPFIVPIVAYTLAGKEHVEKFSFRPVQPAGAALALFRAIDSEGVAQLPFIFDYLEASLLDDAERQRWTEFLNSDLLIQRDTLIEVYRTMLDVYSSRPTAPPSASDGGGSPKRQTSRAAARSKASASKTSRS